MPDLPKQPIRIIVGRIFYQGNDHPPVEYPVSAIHPVYNRYMPDALEIIRQKLAHVRWMGGSPCAGKSTIADALVERYGMRLYRCDDAFPLHTQRTNPHEQPVFYRVMRLSCDGLWMRPVAQQVAEEIEIYQEEFPMILRDLLAMPVDMPILAEGAALLPELVAPWIDPANPRQAVWLTPTAEFQRFHYARRDWPRQVVRDCKDPDQAFGNWMERDVRFAEYVRSEANQRGWSALLVDGVSSIAENTAWVEIQLGLKQNL